MLRVLRRRSSLMGITVRPDSCYFLTSSLADTYVRACYMLVQTGDCIYDDNVVASLKKAYNSGHLVGSHTWAHLDLSTLSWDESACHLPCSLAPLTNFFLFIPSHSPLPSITRSTTAQSTTKCGASNSPCHASSARGPRGCAHPTARTTTSSARRPRCATSPSSPGTSTLWTQMARLSPSRRVCTTNWRTSTRIMCWR